MAIPIRNLGLQIWDITYADQTAVTVKDVLQKKTALNLGEL
jgi:hypothetical protein